jgi:hypothetical protein
MRLLRSRLHYIGQGLSESIPLPAPEAQLMAGRSLAMTFVMRKHNKLVRSLATCHCEERSDEAIS